ncbi:MAG: hypothetical protein JW932_16980 [Deltaproteobacteria bacterium]|nr:hypothetical protein [Deltaproteobacteria bacterium]
MGYLLGLKEYLGVNYETTIFDQAAESGHPWEFHLHGYQRVQASVLENLTYDVKLDIKGEEKKEIPKIHIKFLYPLDTAEAARPLLKIDNRIKDLALEPIVSPKDRYFIKNKSLFPLMKEKQVVFFYSLEGDVIRGIIMDFSRYDITVALKGGTLITILRHSIYDLRDKKGRCFLKSNQEKTRDWRKSDLYVKD